MTHQLVDVRPTLRQVRRRVEALAPARGPSVERFCEEVRDVVIIASSSRGGSSVFSETLRASPHLVHLQAELNPLLTLAGLHPLDTGGADDALDVNIPMDAAALDRELALDAGNIADGPPDIERWAYDIAWRLLVQWPDLPIDPEWVFAVVLAAWHAPQRPSRRADLVLHVHLAVIYALHARWPHVRAAYWDISQPAHSPATLPPEGPPGHTIVEEPPFVTVGPWDRVSKQKLATSPLLIKTPSNCYRLPFLAALFPRARFRVLHLTRNPAASINGLVDGWQFHGFHSHAVTPALNVEGYSNVRPLDARFWKYDLFPGWRDYAHLPLVDIAAAQWTHAHRYTLDFLDQHPDVPSLRVPFESITGDLSTRRAAFHRVADWIGIPIEGPLERLVHQPLPPVMATARPRARRWFARADALAPTLQNPLIRDTARRLGYDSKETWT